MNNFKKYKIVIAIWFGFMYTITTFLFPYMQWSQNKIEGLQIFINFVLWLIIYFVAIALQKKRFDKLKNQKDEKMD